MPLRNRVTPMGELVATPERGLVYANRGCLHDEAGRIRRRWATRRWIACRLSFKGWQRGPLMAPGRFTELFFLDEATALAAGHRPCALCRRADYDELVGIWAQVHPGPRGADAMDARLQAERINAATGARRLHRAAFGTLPDGTFVIRDGEPWVLVGRRLLAWGFGGYAEAMARPGPHAAASVLTPPSLVELLRRRAGEPLVPLLHPSALR